MRVAALVELIGGALDVSVSQVRPLEPPVSVELNGLTGDLAQLE
jgi:hypothetical protein